MYVSCYGAETRLGHASCLRKRSERLAWPEPCVRYELARFLGQFRAASEGGVDGGRNEVVEHVLAVEDVQPCFCRSVGARDAARDRGHVLATRRRHPCRTKHRLSGNRFRNIGGKAAALSSLCKRGNEARD